MNANDAAEMEAYARVLAKYREAFREDPPARAWPAIARNEEDMEEDMEEEARRGRLVVRVVPKNEQSGSASGASDGEKLSDELTSAMEGDAATTGAPREARRLPGGRATRRSSCGRRRRAATRTRSVNSAWSTTAQSGTRRR